MAIELDIQSLRAARQRKKGLDYFGLPDPNASPANQTAPDADTISATEQSMFSENKVLDVNSLRAARQKRKGLRDVAEKMYEAIDLSAIPTITTKPFADPNDITLLPPEEKGAAPIGFTESVKEEFQRPAKGAQYVPGIGGVVGTAENLLYLDAANRLSSNFDYSKPIRKEQLMPGAMGYRPARYTTFEKDRKLIEDMIIRAEKQSRGYTFGGKVAKGLMILPTWMAEFAMTGGLAKLGSTAAKEAGEKLIGRWAKTKAGQLALRGAGWTGGAITRSTLGLAPRIAEKATRRQVNVQILGAEKEGWATSFAKAWGDVTIEAASEEAGQAITGGLTSVLRKLPLGKTLTNRLYTAWKAVRPKGTQAEFLRKISTKLGYSNLIGEIGEERLATVMHAIAKTQDFGAGKDAGVVERLKAGLKEDAKNFPVELTVLSAPGAARFAGGKVLQHFQESRISPDIQSIMDMYEKRVNDRIERGGTTTKQDVEAIVAQGREELKKAITKEVEEPIKTIKTSIGKIEIPAKELDVKWDKALEVIYDYGNQTAAGKPLQPDLPRSLSMGDTVEYEGKTWLVMPQGWQDVSHLTKEQIDKLVGTAKIPIPMKEEYSSKDNAETARRKFDAYWKWHKEAGLGEKPADLKNAVFEYLTDQPEYQEIEIPLFDLDDKGKYDSPEGKRLQAQLDKMKAALEHKLLLTGPGKTPVAPAPTEKQYTLVKGYTRLEYPYEGKTGTFIKESDGLIGVRFADGKEFYFYPDQVKPVGEEQPKPSTAYQQYNKFKEKYPDTVVLMKMGDFYEAFGDDAEILKSKLGITITKRNDGTKVAGLPYHALDSNLKKLIQAGYKVAVAEPTEKKPDGKVSREVVRLITPKEKEAEPKPEIKEGPEVKPHAVEILPRKSELLAEIKEAIAKAPSEQALKSKLQKEIPEPANTLPTEEWQKAVADKAKRISEAVENLQAQKVKFDIDGGAEIINTKEALQTFYNSVSKLKEKETIPRRPTPKKRGVGKPIAAKKEEIGPLYKAPAGYFTDGHLVIKGTQPAKARYSEEEKEIKQESLDEVLNNPTEPAEFMHYAFSSPEAGEGVSGQPILAEPEKTFAVFKSQGKYYVYVQNKFNAIRNRYPEAKYGIYQKSGQLTAYQEGKPVAALMPIRGEKGPARDEPPVTLPGIQTDEAAEADMFFPTVDVESLKAERQFKKAEQAEPTNISNIVVDEFRDWPEQIPKVGKDYWTEVMAAAKSFMTPLRYKALRQTLLGAFRYRKGLAPAAVGIELQDVRDALTATHELGHDLDWQLNVKLGQRGFPSSIKARLGETDAKERELRDELKKVSKVLRPDLWTNEKKAKYLNRHTELMADFISYYILDPEGVREIAPVMSRLFEAKLSTNPKVFDAINRLQQVRFEGPDEPPIAEHIRETFPLPKEFAPLKLSIDMKKESYVKAAEDLGITATRHYKLLMQKADRNAQRIDELVPARSRQTDLVVIAENGSKNPWTGKTKQQILKEGLTDKEQKAVNLYRAYQEEARQTVNKYLRGADIAEYIKFIDDYFIHAYHTPLTEKYKTAISRWAKRSPQAKKRVLPSLAEAVEMGLKPRAKTLGEGLKLWAGINYRVATNKAFLRILPKITNEDGMSILQSPKDYPHWPTVDYWPIRKNYAVPLRGRGVLLFQGRVAVDPKVKPFIDAMFGRRSFSTPVRIIEGFNAITKAMELTLFSFFHHQAEFFSTIGSLGPRAMPFIGGFYGKKAQSFGKEPKMLGLVPAHIGVLKAGKQLEKTPEFMADYLAHGGQVGAITTEGIGLMERMLKKAADYFEDKVQKKPTSLLTGAWAAAYTPVKGIQEFYSAHQRLLWDNVQRAKLVAYYNIVADGAKHSDLPIKEIKETAAKYIADNFGGQEWLNTAFRKPKVRQFWTQLWMSLDWTWSQIKTARWPFAYGGKTETEKTRRAFMRKIGRHHWFWYLTGIAGFTIAGSYAMSGKFPWDNEKGHKLDIDWTRIWRALPWNSDWEKRGDYSRRYISLGKAGRELVRWVTSPLRAFGYKLSPAARTIFEQSTGYNMGSKFPEPWAKEDMELYQEMYHRFGNVMEKFKPFSFSGNNAFLAFSSRKGMTQWKAMKAYEEIYDARAVEAMGGLAAGLTKVSRIIKGSEDKLTKEIEDACEQNRVDTEQAKRSAMAGIRSKYYRLFWKSTMLPEKEAIKECNRYAEALIELGITPTGFKQSLRYRKERLPEEAQQRGIEIISDVAGKR